MIKREFRHFVEGILLENLEMRFSSEFSSSTAVNRFCSGANSA